MIVVSRFHVEPEDPQDPGATEFRRGLEHALALLAAKPGYLDGEIGRNVDDPALWTLVTRWANPGSYRRALSAYDVKLEALPLLYRAIDEPSAYEVVRPGGDLNRVESRSLD
ncbi:MAG: antibiotic biosynthesis monooxygenase [Nocardioides sp.]